MTETSALGEVIHAYLETITTQMKEQTRIMTMATHKNEEEQYKQSMISTLLAIHDRLAELVEVLANSETRRKQQTDDLYYRISLIEGHLKHVRVQITEGQKL